MAMMFQLPTKGHLYVLDCCKYILVLLALFVLKADPDVTGRACLGNSVW